MTSETTCAVDGCERPHYALGWCNLHYQRVRVHGTPLAERPQRTPNGEARRFFEEAMLLETDECIIWPYTVRPDGYGIIRMGGTMAAVHRLSLMRQGDPPTDKPQALHGPCNNKRCFNPKHLSWGTPIDNIGRDRERDGTVNRGERHGHAKLLESQVVEIRRSQESGRILAERYGVTRGHIYGVRSRRTWTHV